MNPPRSIIYPQQMMTTMARLILPFLFVAIQGGKEGSFAVRLPAAQAFAPQPQAYTRELRNEGVPPSHLRSPPRQRRLPNDAATLLLSSSSEDDPLDASSASSVTNSNNRLILPLTAVISLSLVILAAFTDNLPGPPIDATAPPMLANIPFGVLTSGSCDHYAPSLILRDIASTLVCVVGALVFVKGVTYSATIGSVESRDSRKIMHTLSAPLFMLLWPLFSNAVGARFFAAIVPLLNAQKIYLAGTSEGGESETDLADAISRSGDASEALGGPFVYVLVLLFSTLLFWRDSPIGIVSISTMAFGDGLADLVGRRLGSSNKWFFNKSKSMAGSAAFVVGSFAGSYGLISWITMMGAMDPLELGTMGLVSRLFAIAIICAGVELIPFGDDNWTVPLSAALLTAFFLH
mmetsp:Transcript_19011/g.40102  ORF Transcript_19011/g.40102 Transcript_19011/m.40102 type:complete len:406 (+) Transcript_19011:2-1219(+)